MRQRPRASSFLSLKQTLGRDFRYQLLKCLSIVWIGIYIVVADFPGVKRINEDLGQITLTPAAFSASSVYNNQPEYQANKANLVVFASQEESSGAWCPSVPVQNRLTEWLQVDFGTAKLMRILFTEGRTSSPNAFVPSFLLRYQRQNGQLWYDYRMRNGTKLLHANHNAQTVATQLDPPIVAKRFRLYPYNELEPRVMCLRLAVYGESFDDGVIEYTIPEGDVYRMDPQLHMALNDSSYDGWWTNKWPHGLVPLSDTPDRRAYLHGGLGLLMDKQYYEGPLPEPEGSHNVVGWFRRHHPTPSGRVHLFFTFDQVRNFTQARFHVLNSLNYVAVFQRALVQFSVGGEHYNRHATPVLMDVRRDIHNRQARWVNVPLHNRVGRYMRITLWFDYDWIVLSEVGFNSTPLLEHILPVEKASDPIQRIPEVDLAELDLELEHSAAVETAVTRSTEALPQLAPGGSQPYAQQNDGLASKIVDSNAHKLEPIEASGRTRLRSHSANTPYIIAIVCCCLGSVAFVSLFAFMVYRLRRYRRKRAKKQRKTHLTSGLDGMKPSSGAAHHTQSTMQQQGQDHHHQQQQFLLANTKTSPLFPATCASSVPISPSTTLSPIYPNNSFHYNPLQSTPPLYGHGYKAIDNGSSFATLQSPSHALNTPLLAPQNFGTLSPMLSEQLNSGNYKPMTTGLDQESLLTLQLLQHASNPSSNLSSIGGLTLARRGVPDASAFVSYPLVSVSPAGMLNLVTATNTTVPAGMTTNTNTMAGKLPFRPPPPPDQPLPPLPPPSTSPDGPGQPSVPCSVAGANGSIMGTSVAPYAASYPMDNGLLVQFDGSMPEYASASLFSGNGSVRQCSTLNSDTTEAGKSKGNIGETYCVPHQNGLHPHFGIWSNPDGGLPTCNTSDLTTMANGHLPMLSKSGVKINNLSEQFTGPSMDSSGLYYLANTPESVQRNPNGLVPLAESQTLFLPAYGPHPSSLFPLSGMTTLVPAGGPVPGQDSGFPYHTQARRNLFDMVRTADRLPNNAIEPSSSDDGPVLLPVSIPKGKSGVDTSSGS